VSASVSRVQRSSSALGGEPSSLHVEVVFHDVDEQHADTIAAEMVSRAHELANLPEHECDVDVNVELGPPGNPGGSSGDNDDDDAR
jgi:hypothetical protein